MSVDYSAGVVEEGNEPLDELIRLAISEDDAGNIEIYSCATRTELILPKVDIPLLIEALMRQDQKGSQLEIVCLDHFL